MSEVPTIYLGSQTSTVIPYEKVLANEIASLSNISKVSLANLKPEMKMLGDEVLVRGAVTWKDLKEFCSSQAREVMTSPTEELALVLSGVATSATGERCFGYGTLRDQIKSLKYVNAQGEEVILDSEREISKLDEFKENQELLKQYQESYEAYSRFKNAPFPRLEYETDLMTGTEGQLGVVTEVILRTASKKNVQYIFIALPKWEKNYEPHMEVFYGVQGMRESIISCELIDENSTKFLPEEERIRSGCDLIFLEVVNEKFEEVYEKLLISFKTISEEDIFEVPAPSVREFRMNIPRYIFEENQKMGVVKKGTDVQVKGTQFHELLDFYRGWTDIGIGYNLFGHFGDAHLHFNFMPNQDQVEHAQNELEKLYKKVETMSGSPFAEHGIGLIKKKFINSYYQDIHRKMFKYLKKKFDSKNIFFPSGFMSEDSI
ncbi:MAG: FAD-binding oxidoreductase [Oligoflexia bacterium]|nr:FAD-binding oxidoreductase [Oligoflexia bacterium]